MDAPVVAALIAGGVAVASPIITFIATKAYERRYLEPISKGRRTVLTGRWAGMGHQEVGPDGPFDAQFVLELTTSRKTVNGTLDFIFDADSTKHHGKFVLEGSFIHDRFLNLDYKSTNENVMQFGRIIGELTADGRTLRGRYLGYGALSERLVHGRFELQRKS